MKLESMLHTRAYDYELWLKEEGLGLGLGLTIGVRVMWLQGASDINENMTG